MPDQHFRIGAASRLPEFPERLAGLAEVSTNLFWSWHRGARHLFRAIDGPLWHLTRHNPVELLQRVDPARLEACANDPAIVFLYDLVMSAYRRSTGAQDTWFARQYPGVPGPIAYFCTEFGFHNSVPIYSGGLGVLAADHIKAASDLGVPMVAVGLLYTRGYFDQRVRLDGWQEDTNPPFDPTITPLMRLKAPSGDDHLATVRIHGREVRVTAWRLLVGRNPVYLLDTDLDGNTPEDRSMVQALYAGGVDNRLKQEAILGIGGVRVLRALGIAPQIWHANEGHAALMLIERLRELLAAGVPMDTAIAEVRRTSIFTTHTPVPAGHDVFSTEQIEAIVGPMEKEFGIPSERLRELSAVPSEPEPRFHMTAVGIRLSRCVLGVSRRHGEVTRDMWRQLWPGREPHELPIRHVTNGVHLSTWMAHHLKDMLDRAVGPGWEEAQEYERLRDAIEHLDDAELWWTHTRMTGLLMDAIHEAARLHWRDEWAHEAAHLIGSGTMLHGGVMTIGFARRFATYKRSTLVLRDPDRLRAILLDPRRPVQIVFSGKAHPADEGGKEMLRQVYMASRDSRYEGRIAFLEDYELHLAHRLVQGVDLWLNLPRPPMEACGTSGMKAALNGVPQLGTADGWWAEGAESLNGWVLPAPPVGRDQDEWDAEQTYRLLEDEIVPLFYRRDHRGIPLGWVRRMKAAMKTATARFTADRMVREYVDHYYPARDGPA